MGDRVHESFLHYWFVLQSPAYALTTMASFIVIGCLVAYMRYEFARRKEEIMALREVNQNTTEFISLITHQMRTPSSSVLWNITGLLEGDFGKLSQRQEELLKKIYGSAKNLVILSQDLLDVTKLGLGRLGFSLQSVSLQEFEKNIQWTVRKFIPIAEEKGIALTSSFSFHREKSLHIDWGRINQAIENLLENALNYTLSGGKVTIHGEDNPSSFLLSVSDTGIGIPQEGQGKIFTKFFRASNAREKQSSGTGIGLYLCKEIIRAHQGNIWFTSQEGQGTTFYFTLPVAPSMMPAWKEVEEFLVKI